MRSVVGSDENRSPLRVPGMWGRIETASNTRSSCFVGVWAKLTSAAPRTIRAVAPASKRHFGGITEHNYFSSFPNPRQSLVQTFPSPTSFQQLGTCWALRLSCSPRLQGSQDPAHIWHGHSVHQMAK